jgi:hypothetical protein
MYQSICHSHQVNPRHEQGAHPAGHVHCIEQGIADGRVLVKVITQAAHTQHLQRYRRSKTAQHSQKKGIGFFSDKRSTGILGPTAVQ